MKRIIYLIIYMCSLTCSLTAQESDSLLTVLRNIERSQTEYTIDIISDGLEELKAPTTKADGLDAVKAVMRACKRLPVKVKVHGKHIYVQHEGVKVERQLKLQGVVQDIRAHKDLIGATVVLMRPDSTVIEQKEAYQKWHAEGFSWETSEFSFTVPARPAKYLFRISLMGYQTTYVEYTIDKVGRREYERGLPPFYLAPQASTMKEVTVTASKVKFYYKGDTIIYNADAFILAEGSMLDALIKQLPGVEMKSDGRIYHEGKFVDDLLLNGKEFFRHDRKLMLENLPAYTVKDIAIYDKQTAENEWLGIKDEHSQRHVIDVRLKKEYMVGWLVNVEAGGGLRDNQAQPALNAKPSTLNSPYLARLFAMRHSDFSRIAIVANANNLDDDSRPGESDNWQRGKTNDLRRTERADIGGFVSDRNKRWETSGNVSVNHQRTEGATRTVRQNYLSTGDTYDHSFSSRTGEDLRLGGWLSFYRNFKNVRWHIDPEFKYHHFNNSSDLASATFNAPVADVSRQLLNDLFSPNASRINLRDTLVNRILRQGSGSGHTWDGTFHTGATIKIPHTNENLRLGAGINLIGREERMFDRQEVRIADPPLTLPCREGVVTFEDEGTLPSTHSTPLPIREGQGGGSSSFHHLRDNHPTRDGKAYFNVGYNIPLGEGWRAIHATYSFEHLWQHHRSTLYLLEEQDPLLTLQDPPLTLPVREGVECSDWQSSSSTKVTTPSLIGRAGGGSAEATTLLPSLTDYYQVMDRANSFDSHSHENRHKLDINLGYKFNKASYGQIWTLLNGDITLHQQHLDYQRGSIDTTLCRTAVSITMDDNTYLDFKNGQIGMTMGIRQVLPALEQRIDLRDDTDPMNVRLGNTRLHPSVTPDFGVSGSYRFKRGYHYMEWHQKRTFNAIAMGCTYDTRTGARTYRPENVNGNYTTDAGYTFHCALDSTNKLNLDLPFHVTHSQSVDLVGTTAGDAAKSTGPQRSKVKRLALSLLPSFKADIGKHHFELVCQPVWERLSSDRQDFQDFSAFTCRTSLSAILKLPWKLDLSTDLNLYTRTGYADAALNTNDFVWNARLSRPFFKGKFLVLLDGFDILGQLSNVTRVMNAQGRTETYTNVMPRYVLLHAVWRFNKQPKKKD
ncbi:MAG: outer membrane beta-barrel protein [Bacteroidaceae bacterium]|nr:outer membrane beta-barrel protein [Bacteroidaceae bacterium]